MLAECLPVQPRVCKHIIASDPVDCAPHVRQLIALGPVSASVLAWPGMPCDSDYVGHAMPCSCLVRPL
jgi:hypothetical protein